MSTANEIQPITNHTIDLIVLNQQFEKIAIIDAYESLLWTDRYNSPGDFEIYTPVDKLSGILKYPVANNYLQIKDSEHTMIIEDTTIESNIETGNHIKIIGRSLESILDRRIVWTQTDITGNLQNGIERLLNEAIINPSDTARKLDNFIFEASEDPAITELTMENQYTGDNLLEIIKTLCETNKIGYKIILNDSNQFVFSLYKGIDRSYNQNSNPYVVFKPSFENIINSNYSDIQSEAKTIALVAGEGEGSQRVTRTVGTGTGLLRKELYVDARDLQSNDISQQEYYAKLDQRGTEKLGENKVKKTFDGQCETTRMFKYKNDFYMGDIVQVADEYGMESSARVTEFIWSSNQSGIESYPTFEAIDDDEINNEEEN